MTVIRPLHIAVILLAVIFILQGAKAHPSNTVVLILAIVAAILAVIDLLAPVTYGRRRAVVE
jgi:membrane-bound ClpP family serine protease